MNKTRLLLALILATAPLPAAAHPHVFAEARLEIVAADDGTVQELRNVWRFDDMFSSSVLMDFDANTNLKLEESELEEISDTIRQSLADYDYFTFINHDGKPVEIAAPDVLHADFQDNQLLVIFSVKPMAPLPASGTLSFGVYDPTLYTAIDFTDDTHLVLEGQGFAKCKHQVIRPDADEVIAQNQAMLTEAFFADPVNNDMGKLFATRLEVTC
ncbi:DUF1007 family protein [Ciceribacter sp. L1K23]|uniref:DUF1007 family protein n=1 Tax=Ciceribacter sp. L1K23 TaxID=2820276 RepID=UPI001B840D35|nr:DUF1007 family protein [Ciceribacter sp. L1K23]MBR0558106.1 DUF1007 family protein [Ciceribacter sp. L1K23]